MKRFFAVFLGLCLVLALTACGGAADKVANIMDVSLSEYDEMDEAARAGFVKQTLEFFAEEGFEAAGTVDTYVSMLNNTKLRSENESRPYALFYMNGMPAWLIAQKMRIEASFPALWVREMGSGDWTAEKLLQLTLEDLDTLDPDDLMRASFAMDKEIRSIAGYESAAEYPINALYLTFHAVKADLDAKSDITRAPGGMVAYFANKGYALTPEEAFALTGIDVVSGTSMEQAGPAVPDAQPAAGPVELDETALLSYANYLVDYPTSLFTLYNDTDRRVLFRSLEEGACDIDIRMEMTEVPEEYADDFEGMCVLYAKNQNENIENYKIVDTRYDEGLGAFEQEIEMTSGGQKYLGYTVIATVNGNVVYGSVGSREDIYKDMQLVLLQMMETLRPAN